MRILILFGGNSSERHVSINSARSVVELLKLSNTNLDIYYIDQNLKYYNIPVSYMYSNTVDDFDFKCTENVEIDYSRIDFAIPILHGKFGEDGEIQKILEEKKVPFLFSSSQVCKNLFDKLNANEIINNIPIDTISNLSQLSSFVKKFKYIILKDRFSGSSLSTYAPKNYSDATKYLETLSDTSNIIAQKRILGQEFSILVVHGIACDPLLIEYEGDYYSYYDKYYPSNAKVTRFKNEKIQDLAEDIFLKIEAKDCIRLDGFIDQKGKIFFIDCNIIPNFELTGLFFQSLPEENYIEFYKFLNQSLINRNLDPINYNPKFHQELSILFGGNTSEKETSLLSACSIAIKLIANHIKPKLYLLKNNVIHLVEYANVFKHNINNIDTYTYIDLLQNWIPTQNHIFIALHGGLGENGQLQKLCEKSNILYNGENSIISETCMNKLFCIKQIEVAKCSHIKSITRKLYTYPYSIKIKSPCVFKPNDDGCSTGVVVIQKQKDANLYIEAVKEYESSVIIGNQKILLPGKEFDILCEEFIETDIITIENKNINREVKNGWLEYTVGYLNGSALAASLTITTNKILSAIDKFQSGSGVNITGPSLILSEKDHHLICSSIDEVCRALNLISYGRIDIFFNDQTKEIIIIEINTLPALSFSTVFWSQCLYKGLTPEEIILKLIK